MVTTGSPPDVMAHVTKVLLDMGLEVQQETDYKLRCVRAKRKKAAGCATGGVTAITMVGSAGSNGVCLSLFKSGLTILICSSRLTSEACLFLLSHRFLRQGGCSRDC